MEWADATTVHCPVATFSYATSRDPAIADRRGTREHGGSTTEVGMGAIGRKRVGGRFVHSLGVYALLASVASASAASVYKCRDAQGRVAYQDRACAATQQQSEIELMPAPPPRPLAPAPAQSEHRHASAGDAERSHKARAMRRGNAREREVTSWECRGADGTLFYRHASCPKSIAGARSSAGPRKGGAKPVAVSATPLPRAEACRRLARAGSIGRSGHEHDETVSTYDKNAGRDPCRRY
jgi:hypothetical protein